jgi:RHS repeat-associated protein
MNNNVTWQQGIASNWMARPASITTSGATNNLALSNYAYDGAGNITSDGVDAFRYDKVSRLVSGTANGATQTATYDSFGNLKTLGAATLSPTATTNRLPATLASYAANGAVTAYGGDLFDLDPFGMIQAAHDATYSSKYWVFIYTADDERIWKYDMGPANTSWWKIRDLGGKVLSEYVNVGASWTAVSSYIYRDGTLLGRYAPGTSYPRRWFAVDHLGTPRRTFGENGTLIEAASYFPFGGHATTPGPAEESLRFTSHERDTAIASGIDYMHARFYAPGVGRFLSIDPVAGNASAPQSVNRYGYVFSNPLNFIDPDGREAREAGQKMKDGDTCAGKVVDGWCTGETITVIGAMPTTPWFPWSWLSPPMGGGAGSGGGVAGALAKVNEFERDFFLDARSNGEPCKSFADRFEANFARTNGSIPGTLGPTGLGFFTGKYVARSVGLPTLPQAARAFWGPITIGGNTFGAVEAAVAARAAMALNFAAVGVAYEFGVATGSAMNASVTRGCY